MKEDENATKMAEVRNRHKNMKRVNKMGVVKKRSMEEDFRGKGRGGVTG